MGSPTKRALAKTCSGDSIAPRAATLRELCRYAAPEQRLLWLALIATVICGTAGPAFALIYGKFVDINASVSRWPSGRVFTTMTAASNTTATTAQSIDTMRTTSWQNAAAFGIVGLVVGVCTWLSGYMLGRAGESVTLRLRLDVFRVRWVCFHHLLQYSHF